MTPGLTARQAQCLTFIRSYMERTGIPPSYQDICKGVGLRSKSGVSRLVHALAERGAITMKRNRARTITVGPDYRALLRTLAQHVAAFNYPASEKLARRILDHFDTAGMP